MNLDLDPDQIAVRDLFERFFETECDASLVRRSELLGFDPGLWTRLRALSIESMAKDAGLFEAVLAAEQAGRAMAPVPLVEHVVTARLLAAAGADFPQTFAPITLALRRSTGNAGGMRVARLVPGGAVADAFVVSADGELLLVETPAPGEAAPNSSGLPCADRVIVNERRLATGQMADALLSTGVDEWRLLTAAMLVGLADAALSAGVTYVSERHQFGVPIGSLQAIQHGLAEFPGPVSGARLFIYRAAWRNDSGEHRLPVDASMALLCATELARAVTARVLHYHGGYGLMEESDAQLFYRRARGWPALLGDPAVEASHLADLLYGSGSG